MNLVALSDIHGDIGRLEEVAPDLSAADCVLLPGDLTNFGREDAASRIVDAVRKYTDRILAVPGNCDYPEVDAYLTREGINLDRRCVVLDRVAFIGIGGSLPCPGKTPNEHTEEELRGFLEGATSGLPPDTPAVLVAHQPPFNTVADRVRNGDHVGSRSVRTFIAEFQPLVCFTGHIHEGRGIDAIGETKVVNPGPLREGGYAYTRIDREIETVEIRGLQYGSGLSD